MARNPYDKLADKLLQQSNKGNSLKKFNIDLNGVLGGGIDNKKIEQQHNQTLLNKAITCLNNHLEFWTSKQYGDHISRITDIKRDIKLIENIIKQVDNKTFTKADTTKLKDILTKHSCD
jgi:cystathionine beta-lyase family protein involved in aluminum resistance